MTAVSNMLATASGPIRPSWFTDELLDRLTSYVYRSDGNGTDPATPLAPYNLLPTASIPSSSEADVAAAVDSARLAQRRWMMRAYSERAEGVLRFHDPLIKHQDEVIDLIQWERGKNRFSAWQEIL